jgi:O-acetyl-ADP-ribose deacetylase (regulator of RNase III)
MAKRPKQRRWRATDRVRTCFVIMPFGIKKDLSRRDKINFDKVYTTVIRPGVESLNDEGILIKCVRADEIARAGFIHERMIQMIADADVALADLTTNNPNVFYELGVRHSLRDRVTVLLRRKGKPNPFNVAGMSTIEYDLAKAAAERAQRDIANFVRNGLLSSTRDSLVHAVLPGLKVGRDPEVIPASEVEEYIIPGTHNRRLGIVGGNLRYTNLSAELRDRAIDVWLSSENVNMEMARPYEGSISGLIRYLGAKKDDTGTMVRDTIAIELRKKMGRRQLVNPGQVVPTSAGELEDSHKVKRIYHAASVYGVVGTGFHPIAQVEQCITAALMRMDEDSKESRNAVDRTAADFESILFPLLGTGTARAEIIQSARRQITAVISYLRARAGDTNVKRVYFLAPTETHRSALRVALAELKITKPARSAQKRSVPRTTRTLKRTRAVRRSPPPRS